MTYEAGNDLSPHHDAGLVGGGEMGELIRQYDWAATPIGPIEQWPQSLLTALSICLHASYPILILWGPEFIQLYNDAYRPILGTTKHPRALGQRGRECWPEIWHMIGPMFEQVVAEGVAVAREDQLFILDRNGYLEETYFTFSYSPIRDETGGVGGVIVICTESTRRVLGERRLHTLRELAARTVEAQGFEEACRIATAALADNPADLPFSLLYLLDRQKPEARLAGWSGLEPGTALSPARIPLLPGGDEAAPVWPLQQLMESQQAAIVPIQPPVEGRGGEAPHRALVMPISYLGQVRPAAFLVAALNPRRPLDDDYRGFFDLIVGQLATALANARAYEEERRRAEELARLDRAKTMFFSNVSHEFRTPLTLLLGPLENLLADAHKFLPPGHQQQLDIAHRNGLRLLKLVNTLLDFTRIEAGRIRARYEPTDLASFTAELASLFRSAIEQASLKLLVNCPPLPEPIFVDREMWEKIVLNLLSNAFKFTFEGEIEVTLAWQGDRVVLRVRDTGIGIPASEIPHLFERFHRVREARSRTHEGTGIGLALVQELVHLHGGRITVQSAPDEGSTFEVALPTGTSHLPQEQVVPVAESITERSIAGPYIEEALHWLPVETRRPVTDHSRPRTGQGAPARRQRARILLADDNADMRAYLQRLLDSRWRVEAVADGLAALAAARRELPDLILADIMMPGLDGLQLLQALRADPRTRVVPLIFLSARAGEEATVEGLAQGADDYLVKPFSARELLARVSVHLELARVRQAAAEQERALRAEAEAAREQIVEILERVRHGFFALDRDWRFTYINSATLEMLAQYGKILEREELVGKRLWETFPEVLESQLFAEYKRAMREQVARHFETYYAPFDSWVEVHVYPSEEGLSVFFQDVTERRWAQELLARAQEELEQRVEERTAALRRANEQLLHELNERRRIERELAEAQRRLGESREAERLHIARELHDSIVQQLLGMSYQLAGWRRRATVGSEGKEPLANDLARALEELQAGVLEIVSQLRRLIGELRPAGLEEFGLAAALEGYVARLEREAQLEEVNFKLELERGGPELPRDVALCLFRVAQEALRNALKHAGAREIRLSVWTEQREVSLQVRDDGRGFELPDRLTAFAERRHFGLVGMQERVTWARGELDIRSSPGAGTTVVARIPLKGERGEDG